MSARPATDAAVQSGLMAATILLLPSTLCVFMACCICNGESGCTSYVKAALHKRRCNADKPGGQLLEHMSLNPQDEQ